ncbi:MAG: hypothetical protein HY814_10970 [Candidatus Riflebacteria bacterium]|nr:hypothetical protein [Candidatus Riflebacteria bacterium]
MSQSRPLDFPVGLLYLDDELGTVLTQRLNETEPFRDSTGSLRKLVAEHIEIAEMDVDHRTKYRVLVDRCSHLLPQAIGAFMMFAHQGVHVINNPLSFQYFIATKDVGFHICRSLGISVPDTIVLPPHTNPALRDPKYFRYHRHFDWAAIIRRLGFPAYLKPAEGRGARKCWKVHNADELLHYYNQSGSDVMTLQRAVESGHEWQVRCLCLGRKIIPIKYTFRALDASTYEYEEGFLSPETGRLVLDQAKVINRAFGYEMNSVEFMLDSQGQPWAIDFNNPVPDGRRKQLGEVFFNDYVNGLLDRVLEVAKDPPPYPFLPAEVNRYAEIARLDKSPAEKFRLALDEANKYYRW